MAKFKKGMQGILYDEINDSLIICDGDKNRLIKLNPVTGTLYIDSFHSFCILILIKIGEELTLCDISDPIQITKSAPYEYLVTSPFKVSIVVKEGIHFTLFIFNF